MVNIYPLHTLMRLGLKAFNKNTFARFCLSYSSFELSQLIIDNWKFLVSHQNAYVPFLKKAFAVVQF